MKTVTRSILVAMIMAVVSMANAQAEQKPIKIDPIKPQNVVLGQWVSVPLTVQVVDKRLRPTARIQIGLEDAVGNRVTVAIVDVTKNGTFTAHFQITTFIPSGAYRIFAVDEGTSAFDITRDLVLYVAHGDNFPQ